MILILTQIREWGIELPPLRSNLTECCAICWKGTGVGFMSEDGDILICEDCLNQLVNQELHLLQKNKNKSKWLHLLQELRDEHLSLKKRHNHATNSR